MNYNPGWRVVVPIRDFRTGKQRLRRTHSDRLVDEIARRLAVQTLETLEAVGEVDSVTVVTDAAELNLERFTKAVVIREEQPAGLNAAVRQGLDRVTQVRRNCWAGFENSGRMSEKTLVLHADLPLLTPIELSHVLGALGNIGVDAFVTDESGRGTTALSYPDGNYRHPCFGKGSARLHQQAGFVPLELPSGHGMRTDLDTESQLLNYYYSGKRKMIESLLKDIDYPLPGVSLTPDA